MSEIRPNTWHGRSARSLFLPHVYPAGDRAQEPSVDEGVDDLSSIAERWIKERTVAQPECRKSGVIGSAGSIRMVGQDWQRTVRVTEI